MSQAIDAGALSKLRWRCRRGLLENDLLIDRFFADGRPVSQVESNGLYLLMELADNDLLDLFLGRTKPTGNLDRPEVRQVLQAVRAAPFRAHGTTPHTVSSSSPSSRTSP